jgi:hypothetical protein
MMYKKGIVIKDWVIMSLVFGAVFALFVVSITGYSSQATNDGLNGTNLINSAIAEHYNTLDQNKQIINNITNTMNTPGGLTPISGFQAFLGGTVAVFNIAMTNLLFIPSLLMSFATDFGIPSSVATIFLILIGGVLSYMIIFAILNASKGMGRI